MIGHPADEVLPVARQVIDPGLPEPTPYRVSVGASGCAKERWDTDFVDRLVVRHDSRLGADLASSNRPPGTGAAPTSDIVICSPSAWCCGIGSLASASSYLLGNCGYPRARSIYMLCPDDPDL